MTDNQTKLLYATLIGAIGATLTPNPGDVLYWQQHKKLRDEWSKGKITSNQYWRRQLTYHYISNSLYWVSLLGVAYLVPGSYQRKLWTAIGLASAGAIFAIVYKHNHNDNEDSLADENALKQKLLENAGNGDIENAENS
jgi:hypothetical protein